MSPEKTKDLSAFDAEEYVNPVTGGPTFPTLKGAGAARAPGRIVTWRLVDKNRIMMRKGSRP